MKEHILRGPCAATAAFAGGRIAFFEGAGFFQAVCNNPLHDRCIMTRSCRAKGGQGKFGGRPVAFLAAWLEDNGQVDKAAHWRFADLRLSLEDRLAQRAMIQADAEKSELLRHERPKVDGEDSEPEDLRGLVPSGGVPNAGD